jgi:hypothetical protein
MTIVFKAPLLILLIALAVFVVLVLSGLLRRDAPWKKILTLVLAFLISGGLILWQYHDTHLVVDAQGIHADSMRKVDVPWSAVTKAQVIAPIASSPFGPKNKTWGMSIGGRKKGLFRLNNGSSGFVLTENPDEALVIQTDTTTYVFGPPDHFDAFIDAVAEHVTVAR